MSDEAFREQAHRAVDVVADYLERLESYDVLPKIEPGAVLSRLPEQPPEDPEPFERALADYRELIEPNITHWQHPGFMAYFPSVASGPGIVGELLAAGLNSNVMLWRNAPASTELELRVVDWLRQLLGLPERYRGMFCDTASVASMLGLVAARQAIPGWDFRKQGLNHPDAPRLVTYQSEHAHSSIERASIAAGLGLDSVRRIPGDADYRMRGDLLAKRIAEDRAAGLTPCCVTATIGTTSMAAVDAMEEIAEICEREKIWLHVDAAYAGAAALLPEKRELFRGWERADSIVFNLHKWFWTPFDATLLLYPDPERFREAFSLTAEYLRTDVGDVVNFNEYGIQLGRRFRALKVWLQLRAYGAEGMRARLRQHCAWAQQLAARVADADDWRLMAPVEFGLLCLRHEPAGLDPEATDRHNAAILERVNAGGRYFLSHAVFGGRYAIRVVIGNPRQEQRHVEGVWRALCAAAS